MKPERFETWLTVDRKGLYCRPGGFHIDPYGGAKRAVITHGHSDHARPGHEHVHPHAPEDRAAPVGPLTAWRGEA